MFGHDWGRKIKRRGEAGGNKRASKAGAWSRSGGTGEEYNEQAGRQVRRIEEGDRKGADSSEDAGGMVGIPGKRIGHDGLTGRMFHSVA